MSWVERFNRAILRRVQPAPGGGDAVAMAEAVPELVRLVAVLRDAGVGSVMMLLGEMPDGSVLQADEHDAGWAELLIAIDRSGRAGLSAREWPLRLIAGEAGVPLVLIGHAVG